jgi:hypothetical protein
MNEDIKTLGQERSEIVVEASEVHRYSDLGYRTLEIREEEFSTIQNLMVQELAPGLSYPINVTKQAVGSSKVLKFFMVRSGVSRVAELSKELELEKRDHEMKRGTVCEQEKLIASLQSTSEQLKLDIERRRVELEKEMVEKEELKKRFRLMEVDIAKFRKEVGEQRWRELTAPPERMP